MKGRDSATGPRRRSSLYGLQVPLDVRKEQTRPATTPISPTSLLGPLREVLMSDSRATTPARDDIVHASTDSPAPRYTPSASALSDDPPASPNKFRMRWEDASPVVVKAAAYASMTTNRNPLEHVEAPKASETLSLAEQVCSIVAEECKGDPQREAAMWCALEAGEADVAKIASKLRAVPGDWQEKSAADAFHHLATKVIAVAKKHRMENFKRLSSELPLPTQLTNHLEFTVPDSLFCDNSAAMMHADNAHQMKVELEPSPSAHSDVGVFARHLREEFTRWSELLRELADSNLEDIDASLDNVGPVPDIVAWFVRLNTRMQPFGVIPKDGLTTKVVKNMLRKTSDMFRLYAAGSAGRRKWQALHAKTSVVASAFFSRLFGLDSRVEWLEHVFSQRPSLDFVASCFFAMMLASSEWYACDCDTVEDCATQGGLHIKSGRTRILTIVNVLSSLACDQKADIDNRTQAMVVLNILKPFIAHLEAALALMPKHRAVSIIGSRETDPGKRNKYCSLPLYVSFSSATGDLAGEIVENECSGSLILVSACSAVYLPMFSLEPARSPMYVLRRFTRFFSYVDQDSPAFHETAFHRTASIIVLRELESLRTIDSHVDRAMEMAAAKTCLHNALLGRYAEPQLGKSQDEQDRVQLFTQVTRDIRQQRNVALIGRGGCGKSMALLGIFSHLMVNYISTYYPVFLDIRGVKHPKSRQAIDFAVQEACGLSAPQLSALNEHRRIVVLIDNVGSFFTKDDPSICELNPMVSAYAIVVACREEVVHRSPPSTILGGNRQTASWKMLPFFPKTASIYKFSQWRQAGITEAAGMKDLESRLPCIVGDIATKTNPLLLRLLISINVDWLKNGNDSHPKTMTRYQIFEEYFQTLFTNKEMAEAEDLALTYLQRSWSAKTTIQGAPTKARTFLLRAHETDSTVFHIFKQQSFGEFLVARAIFRDTARALRKITRPLGFHVEPIGSFLREACMGDAATQHDLCINRLLPIVMSSKGDDATSKEISAASVALSLMNTVGFSMRGLQLNNICIANAELDAIGLNGANLSGAMFSKCAMGGADFNCADIDGSVWRGTTVGVPLPPLRVHRGRVHCVASTPDGTQLITCGEDGDAHVWDSSNGEHGIVLSGHNAPVLCAAASSELYATGAKGGEVILWNARGVIEQRIPAHDGDVLCLCAGIQPGTFLSAGSDRIARLWVAGSEKPLAQFKGHTNDITCMSVNPLNECIATGSRDTTVRTWKINGAPMRTFKYHSQGISAVLWDADGRLVSISIDGMMTFWKDGYYPRHVVRHPGRISAAALANDGAHIICGGLDGAITTHCASTGTLLRTSGSQSHSVSSVCCVNRHSIVLTGGEDVARSWCTTQFSISSIFQMDMGLSPLLQPSCTGALVAVVMGTRVVVGDVVTGAVVHEISIPAGVVSMSFSECDDMLVTCNSKGTVEVWRFNRLDAPIQLRGSGATCVKVSAGNMAVVGFRDGTLRSWNLGNFSQLKMFKLEEGTHAIYGLDASENARDIVFYGNIPSFSLARKRTQGTSSVRKYQTTHPVVNATMSADGNTVVTLMSQGDAQVWTEHPDDPDRMLSRPIYIPKEQRPPHWKCISVAMDANGSRILLGGSEGSILVLGIGANNDYELKGCLCGLTSAVNYLFIDPTATKLFSSSTDEGGCVWVGEELIDVKCGTLLSIPKPLEEFKLAKSIKTKTVATLSGTTGTIKTTDSDISGTTWTLQSFSAS